MNLLKFFSRALAGAGGHMKIGIISPLIILAACLMWQDPRADASGGDAKADAATIFNSKCAFCHNKDGRGKPNWRAKGMPDFTDPNWQKSRTDQQIIETIRNGKGKFMPPWKEKLSEEQIKALVGYVRAFGAKK
jgi:cbb3-type cytochrome c oxidase subunit III